MIEFMLLGPPRSATTWAANWLTTDTTLCLHDPLYKWHYSALDSVPSKRRLGVSCTGLMHFPDWVNSHKARKVILHRSLVEVNESLDQIGLPAISAAQMAKLDGIEGLHVEWRALFERPEPIYEHLLQMPFDEERHKFLSEIEMQPEFGKLKVNKQATQQLVSEVMSSMEN